MQLGESIDNVTLLDHRGQPWTLAEHAGTPVVLIFHRHLM